MVANITSFSDNKYFFWGHFRSSKVSLWLHVTLLSETQYTNFHSLIELKFFIEFNWKMSLNELTFWQVRKGKSENSLKGFIFRQSRSESVIQYNIIWYISLFCNVIYCRLSNSNTYISQKQTFHYIMKTVTSYNVLKMWYAKQFPLNIVIKYELMSLKPLVLSE